MVDERETGEGEGVVGGGGGFFFNDTATTEIYTLSLHDALPISEIAGEKAFALEFLQMQANHTVDLEAVKADLATSRVWWFGGIEDEEADFYIRVQSDRYLVELLQSNTFGVVSEVASNHVHASFRDLTNDWDYDALGAHLHEHHPEFAVYSEESNP